MVVGFTESVFFTGTVTTGATALRVGFTMSPMVPRCMVIPTARV